MNQIGEFDTTSDSNQNQMMDLDLELRVMLSRIQERLAFRISQVRDDLQGQQRLMEELQTWSSRLDRSVHRTSTQIDSALSAFSGLVEELNSRLGSTFKELKKGLEETRGMLDNKREDLENVMDTVGQIGKTIRMLSINAQIASAKAGEHGKTFSVVAREIKSLANEATDASSEAVKIMNLSDIEKLLNDFDLLANDTLKQTSQSLQRTQTQLMNVIDSSRAELSEISSNSRIVAETLGSARIIADRLLDKNTIASELSREIVPVWTEANPFDSLHQIADKERIRTIPDFDRLDEIRQRGSVRIAIEPDFKGLSFHLGSSNLRGLDVEYAKAFAHWLNVRCEFIEYPWDQCTSLLWAGRYPGEAEADLMWSALPPNPRYYKVGYSETYTYLEFVLARRIGDSRIGGIDDLNGRTLGCINDPAALKTLEDAGVRWAANAELPGCRVRLGNLITYSDQSRIHDCLADGLVDAFAVDRPIYYWACQGNDSPWKGKIEILPGNLATTPWYYAVGVADDPSSFRLLQEINKFVRWFRDRPERRQIELTWQGGILESRIDYHNERANLRGETEMIGDYQSWIQWLEDNQS
jgi:ABC-type amino acid transport substrate-binding protein/ABC-type transporter Mla subunit MlaD